MDGLKKIINSAFFVMKLILVSMSLINIGILIGGDWMKRICSFVLVLFLTLSLLGCNQSNIGVDGKKSPSEEPGIIGYVMNEENTGILVVSQVVQDFSATGGVEEFYNAIWFSNAPQDVEIGDKVKVWYDEVLESYPGQSEAKHVEVISSQKPNGANLTESEALYKTLTSKEVNRTEVAVVKFIEYNKQTDKWNIVLKETWGDKIVNIEVED
jgi:hypothetical protein